LKCGFLKVGIALAISKAQDLKFSKNARCEVKFKSQAAGRRSVNFNLLCSAKVHSARDIFGNRRGYSKL